MSNMSKELLREYIKEQNFTICVDGFNGFKETIGATFPFAKIQRRIKNLTFL